MCIHPVSRTGVHTGSPYLYPVPGTGSVHTTGCLEPLVAVLLYLTRDAMYQVSYLLARAPHCFGQGRVRVRNVPFHIVYSVIGDRKLSYI